MTNYRIRWTDGNASIMATTHHYSSCFHTYFVFSSSLIPQLSVLFVINIFYKSLRSNKFPRVLPFAEFSLTLWCQNKRSNPAQRVIPAIG